MLAELKIIMYICSNLLLHVKKNFFRYLIIEVIKGIW